MGGCTVHVTHRLVLLYVIARAHVLYIVYFLPFMRAEKDYWARLAQAKCHIESSSSISRQICHFV